MAEVSVVTTITHRVGRREFRSLEAAKTYARGFSKLEMLMDADGICRGGSWSEDMVADALEASAPAYADALNTITEAIDQEVAYTTGQASDG